MKAEDYPEFARDAVKEMHRQVGGLITDGEGLARRGLIVRHLVMPGQLDETEAILTWVARELGLRNLDERRPHRKLRMLRMV